MRSLDQLPEALRLHYQKEEASCAASAFECVAKLHGRIAPGSFPLQADPQNQKKGFGDKAFLSSHGLEAKDDFYGTADAVMLIENETNGGRFPLISLLVSIPNGQLGYHVYLCAQHGGDLLMIDPAKPEVVLKGKTDLFATLERDRLRNPERDRLHILTYEDRKLKWGAITKAED